MNDNSRELIAAAVGNLGVSDDDLRRRITTVAEAAYALGEFDGMIRLAQAGKKPKAVANG